MDWDGVNGQGRGL